MGCKEQCYLGSQILCCNYEYDHSKEEMRELCEVNGSSFQLLLSEVFNEGLESD